MSIAVACPGCESRLTAPDAAAGKTLKCPKCKAALAVPGSEAVDGIELLDDPVPLPVAPDPRSKKPSAAKPDVVDEDNNETMSPTQPRYRATGSLRFGAAVFEVVGTLCLLGGLFMDTTVGDGANKLHNIGLVSQQQLLVLGGLGSICLGSLLRLRAAIESMATFYCKQKR